MILALCGYKCPCKPNGVTVQATFCDVSSDTVRVVAPLVPHLPAEHVSGAQRTENGPERAEMSLERERRGAVSGRYRKRWSGSGTRSRK